MEVPNLSISEVTQLLKTNVQVLDIRDKNAFAQAHIPKSINIPLSPAFATWAKRVLVIEIPVLVVADSYPIQGITDLLIRSGFSVSGVLAPFEKWQEATLPIDHVHTLSIQDLENQFLIDVRSDDEWKQGHIAHATHIQINDFYEQLNHIPKDQNIAIICASGNRSSIFASLLKKEGYIRVANVVDGMMAWIDAKLPVIK